MSQVARNIVWNVAGQALVAGFGFLGTRLVFHTLGDEALGVLYFALAIYAVAVPLLDMGISASLVREIAAHFQTDCEYIAQVTRTATLLYWSGYAILALLVWSVAPLIASHWLKVPSIDVASASRALRVLALALLLMFPRSFYSNILRGLQRMEFNNTIDVGTAVLHQAGTVVAVLLGGGLVQIAYVYFAVLLLSNAAYI